MLMMIDPDRQPIAERLEKRHRRFFEIVSAGEGHVHHRHAPFRRSGQVSRLFDEDHAHQSRVSRPGARVNYFQDASVCWIQGLKASTRA